MSLKNKLGKIGEKIEYYTELLNNKTNEINTINFEDEKSKLAKWGKYKINLNQDLKKIDDKLTRFTTDSYNYIHKLETHNISKFGNKEEEEENYLKLNNKYNILFPTENEEERNKEEEEFAKLYRIPAEQLEHIQQLIAEKRNNEAIFKRREYSIDFAKYFIITELKKIIIREIVLSIENLIYDYKCPGWSYIKIVDIVVTMKNLINEASFPFSGLKELINNKIIEYKNENIEFNSKYPPNSENIWRLRGIWLYGLSNEFYYNIETNDVKDAEWITGNDAREALSAYAFDNLKKNVIDIKSENDNINEKMYNFMLYGTFMSILVDPLEYSKNSYINDQIIIGSNGSFITKSNELLNKFITILNKNNAYIAGGYINMAINYPHSCSLDGFKQKEDMDIYVKKDNFINFVKDIIDLINPVYFKYDISSPYMESFFKQNGLLGRFTLFLKYINIDILIIRDDKNLIDVIDNFDLTYCSVYLDPTNLNPDKCIIKGKIDDMLKKYGKLNDIYAQKYLFNKFIQKRIKKYKNRGYTTNIDTELNIVIKKEEKKEIDESVIVNKLLQYIYKKYQNIIKIEVLIYNISILDYTLVNLIECCKTISQILYNNQNYYYYVLTTLITDYINKVLIYSPSSLYALTGKNREEDVAVDPPAKTKKPLYYKFYNELLKIQSDLINSAYSQENIVFLTQPFDYGEIFELLPNIINLFVNYPSDSVFHKFYNKYSMNSSAIIDQFITIYNKNPTILFNKILMNSTLLFLSNPKYINFIMTLFIIEYEKIKYQPKYNIFSDNWFSNIRFKTAFGYNFKFFNDEISEYNDDKINLREIAYYDSLKDSYITYTKLNKYNDYLIFIIEDLEQGFTFRFDKLTTPDLCDFFLELEDSIVRRLNVSVTMSQLKDKHKWYSKLGIPYNIGILTAQLYQALSLYENSNNKIKTFILSSSELLSVIDIKSIQWENAPLTKNIWNDSIIMGIDVNKQLVYNRIQYIN